MKELEASRPADWHPMYDEWAVEYNRALTISHVALPLLIKSISTTDYGDLAARNGLISRLQESAHSCESTMILLGSRSNVDFGVSSAKRRPMDIGYDLLPPLSSDVKQALGLEQKHSFLAYFRLAVRTFQQLWQPAPAGCRQSEYGCWSGESSHLLPSTARKSESTGGGASTYPADAGHQREPLDEALNIKKLRSTMSGPDQQAESTSSGSSRNPSGSSVDSGGTASSSHMSSSLTMPSSTQSHPDISLSTSASGVIGHVEPGEARMLAALSGSSSALEDGVFLYIGALFARQTSADAAVLSISGDQLQPVAAAKSCPSQKAVEWTGTDYIVAINLCDLAVYIVYIAWARPRGEMGAGRR
jgi:hypothetical protein